MKILIIGLGSIGQRHVEILLRKYQHGIFAFRSKSSKKNSLGIEEFYSWDDVQKLKPEIAFITNPTSLHIETAIKCAKLNCKLFIEKPIGNDLKGLNQLVNLVKESNLVTYVAYNLRFHPVIKELKKYFDGNKFLHMNVLTTSYYPNWRRNTDYKKRYTANLSLGGGAILDLSHEIDYAHYFLGRVKSVVGQFSRRADVTVDSEDYADMLLKTDEGPCNIHINFFGQRKQRIIQIDFEGITVVGDLINSTIEEYQNEKLLAKKQLDTGYNLSYEKQLEYFMENINNPGMMNNLVDAAKLYRKIIKFKEDNYE